MLICNTEKPDLDFIYYLFDEAIAYQKRKAYPVWPDYDKTTLANDIDKQLQFKLLTENSIACIFSICYSDEIIWRERNNDRAIYLHRIVVNPAFKGRKLFGEILSWVKQHCQIHNIDYIRMDTWADNPTIIDYYKQFGFQEVGHFTTPDSDELPLQQRGNHIVLLELKI